MYVSIYLCMYLCMYVCMCVCMYVQKLRANHDHKHTFTALLRIGGVFLFIPTFQFVFLQSSVNSRDSNTCHYNHRCKRSLLLNSYIALDAFNNIWSNTVYIYVGVALYTYFSIREYRYNAKIAYQEKIYGVLHNWDLYKGLGLAVIGEGFFSACWHTCPTYWNIQFDFLFMYFTVLFGLFALVAKRRPYLLPAPSTFFLGYSALILINFYGAYVTFASFSVDSGAIHLWFWIPLLLAYTGILLGALLKFKYHHDFSFHQLFHFIRRSSRRNHASAWIIGLCFFCQYALMIFCTVNQCDSPVYMLNHLFVYLFFGMILYFVRKIKNHERTRIQAYIIGVICAATFLASIGFKESNVAEYAAEILDDSRSLSKDCVFLFYDAHDMWHFLSACGFGLICLFVYHVDDDLGDVPVEKIVISF